MASTNTLGGTGEVARARQILTGCRAALLDMNGTFMFGEDRLSAAEDFGATYRALGGAMLPDTAVTAGILACVAHMARLYDDPARVDDFPGVLETLGELPETAALPSRERERLAEVVARHELGHVPAPYAAAVQRLARSLSLVLVANIWAPKALWLEELARVGISDAFAVCVFSSDSRSMKPSQALFHAALRGIGIPNPGPYSDVVCIGDSLRCDVAGPQALGIRTIWIDRIDSGAPSRGPVPDARVPNLLALVPER